jgi:hypothetical protein
MYKDLDKKRAADRERQNRRRGKVVTPVTPFEDVTPSVTPCVTPEFVKGMANWAKKRGKVPVVIPGAIKRAEDVPKLTPRSIGMGIDTRLEMQRWFVGK